jgi:hypothetical protein
MVACDGRTSAERTFTDLVWPAAAGNIVWAVVTIVVQKISQAAWAAESWWLVTVRLLTLTLLAWYLHSEWIRLANASAEERARFDWLYWLGDGLLVFGVVFLALALTFRESPSKLLYGTLSSINLLAGLWHACGWWAQKNPEARTKKAAINGYGIGLLWLVYVFAPDRWPLVPMLISLGVVLVVWEAARLDDLPSGQKSAAI